MRQRGRTVGARRELHRLGGRCVEQREGHLVGLRAIRRLGRQAGIDELQHALRDPCDELPQGLPRAHPPRWLTGQGRPRQSTEGIDVGLDRGPETLEQLGGDHAVGAVHGGDALTGDPTDAEVGQHGHAVRQEEHVARGKITVDHPGPMQVGQRTGQRRHDRDQLPRREVATTGQHLRQGPSPGELDGQGDRGRPTVGARKRQHVVEVDQVPVPHSGQHGRFPHRRRHVAIGDVDDLEGNQERVGLPARTPHPTGRTGADRLQQAVAGHLRWFGLHTASLPATAPTA